MCGIFGVFNYQGDVSAYRQRALYLSKKYVVYSVFFACTMYHSLTQPSPVRLVGSDIVVLTGQAV
jgi:hypothetical protein